MLYNTLKRLIGEVQSVKAVITALKRGHYPVALAIVLKSPVSGKKSVQDGFSRMAERGMSEVMGQSHRFHQLYVKPQPFCQASCDLGDLHRMSQTGPVIVAFVVYKHLCLVLQLSKCLAMDDAIPVTLINAARIVIIFLIKPSPAVGIPHGINR